MFFLQKNPLPEHKGTDFPFYKQKNIYFIESEGFIPLSPLLKSPRLPSGLCP
jgi:hypothetical protein